MLVSFRTALAAVPLHQLLCVTRKYSDVTSIEFLLERLEERSHFPSSSESPRLFFIRLEVFIYIITLANIRTSMGQSL
jgi:hypothetical protein